MKNRVMISILSLSFILTGSAVELSTPVSVTANYDFNGSKVTLGSVKKLSETGNVTYSPDGSRYIIQKNQDLYLIENGKEKHIAQNAVRFQWSPDGESVYFAEAPSNSSDKKQSNLWKYDLKKANKQHAGKTDMPFRFSLNKAGKIISSNEKKIELTDPTTQTTKTLAALDSEDYLLSPDGNWIAYISGTNLSLIEVSSGNVLPVSKNLNPRHWDDFSWSADSKQLAYLNHLAGISASLMIYNLQDHTSKTLYTTEEDGFYAGIKWLKNDHLIYQFIPLRTSNPSEHARYEVMDPVNPQPVVLFTNGLGLRLSEDGKKITFIRDHEQSSSPYVAELNY